MSDFSGSELFREFYERGDNQLPIINADPLMMDWDLANVALENDTFGFISDSSIKSQGVQGV